MSGAVLASGDEVNEWIGGAYSGAARYLLQQSSCQSGQR